MNDPPRRDAPLEMPSEEFRRIGHALVDDVAAFLESLPRRPVTTAEPPSVIRSLLGEGPIPEEGMDPGVLLEEASTLLRPEGHAAGAPVQAPGLLPAAHDAVPCPAGGTDVGIPDGHLQG